jgi:hypothetical protein
MISKNLTLITAIMVTSALTAGGTYFATTRSQPAANTGDNEQRVELSAKTEPVTVAAAPGQPIEIIVKTEVEEKHRGKRHDFGAEAIEVAKQPQPNFTIFQGK